MSLFSIFIVQPRGWSHVRMFLDIASSVAESLRALGHEVNFNPGPGETIVNPSPPLGRSIVFAPHFLPDAPLAEDTILFCLEQVPGPLGKPGELAAQISEAWLRGDFLKVYRRHEVWSFSRTCVERLRRLGVERVQHVRVGMPPRAIPRLLPTDEDIDVLHYGTLSPRRQAVLEQLQSATVNGKPVRVSALAGVYGLDRDRVIARAKIVLNLHCNEPLVAPAIFEVVRCAHLWMNKKCIVSEAGSDDPYLGELADAACVTAPYEKLAATCVALLDDARAKAAFGGTAADVRKKVAERGHKVFAEISQVDEVARVLSQSGLTFH